MPGKLETIREWVRIAHADLTGARPLIDATPALLELVCFHCQQSAEKMLKSFFTARNVAFPKVHAMILLYDLCEKVDPSFVEIRDAGEWLTRFAVQVRYPWGRPPTMADATKALADADQIMSFVLERLPAGSHA